MASLNLPPSPEERTPSPKGDWRQQFESAMRQFDAAKEKADDLQRRLADVRQNNFSKERLSATDLELPPVISSGASEDLELPPAITDEQTEQAEQAKELPKPFCSPECDKNGSCKYCIDPAEIPQIEQGINNTCNKVQEITESPICKRKVSCAPDPVLEQAYRRADISWPAEINMAPQEWKHIEPLLNLQYQWDKRVKNNTIKILTQNLHFRPYDIGSSLRTILETIGAETNWGKTMRSIIGNAISVGAMGAAAGYLGLFINPLGLVAGTAVGLGVGMKHAITKFLTAMAQAKVPLLIKDIILREMRFTLEDRAWINKMFPGLDTSGQLFNECIEIHSQNAQERRACEFVGAITLMDDHERPDIICVQEATHESANRILYDKLELIGYTGVKQTDVALALPILNPPGLAIYVSSASGIKIIATDSLVFGSIGETVKGDPSKDISESQISQAILNFFTGEKKTIGADNLGYKGCLAVEILVPKGVAGMDKDTYIIVATIHPSPYVKITTGDTLFDYSSWFCMVEEYGEVVKIHKKQLDDAAAFLRRFRKERIYKHLAEKKIRPGESIQLFMTGDMNINRYAVSPDSDEEKNPFDASACCSVEFYDMLRRLNAEQPPVIPDPNKKRWETYSTKWVKNEQEQKWEKVPSESVSMPAGRGGMFTWDGELNKITQSPKWPESFSWIDYILYSKDGPRPLYMDNRAIRLTSKKAFPEVSSYFQPTCIMFRKELVKRYKEQIPKVEKQIRKMREKQEKGTTMRPVYNLPLDYTEEEEEAPQTENEQETIKKELDILLSRKRTLEHKVCQLETVNSNQQCETSKKCSTMDLTTYNNTYNANGKSFTCDYEPRVTISKKNWENKPNLGDIESKNKAWKDNFDKSLSGLQNMTAALRAIGVLEPGFDFKPKYNDDGTVTIDREEFANPAFHAAEREVMQKNPFPLFSDISDHYAVMAVIMLPSETNSKLYNETMKEYEQLDIHNFPAQVSDTLELVKARRMIGSMAPASDFIEPKDIQQEIKPVLEEITDEQAATIEEIDTLRKKYTKAAGWFTTTGVLDAETVDAIIKKAIDNRLTREDTEALLQDAQEEEEIAQEEEKIGRLTRVKLPPSYK